MSCDLCYEDATEARVSHNDNLDFVCPRHGKLVTAWWNAQLLNIMLDASYPYEKV